MRQGDPMSPYIFVLCMERLSYAINRAVDVKKWLPIKVSRSGHALSHIFFAADDMMLFAKSTYEQALVVNQMLEEFSMASGHKVSLGKSSIFFSKNMSRKLVEYITKTLGIGATSNLGRYLGGPNYSW